MEAIAARAYAVIRSVNHDTVGIHLGVKESFPTSNKRLVNNKQERGEDLR